MNSFNHCALGVVTGFLVRRVADGGWLELDLPPGLTATVALSVQTVTRVGGRYRFNTAAPRQALI